MIDISVSLLVLRSRRGHVHVAMSYDCSVRVHVAVGVLSRATGRAATSYLYGVPECASAVACPDGAGRALPQRAHALRFAVTRGPARSDSCGHGP